MRHTPFGLHPLAGARRSLLPRSRKPGAFLLAIGLLGSLFAVVAPVALAEPVSSGVLGGFENEGDQLDPSGVDAAGDPLTNFDWQTVRTDPRITQWVEPIVDDGLTWLSSAKENDPSQWGCMENEKESTPKDDILRVYLASQITADDQLLHIGYVRASGGGDTDINIEFNQVSAEFTCVGDTDGRIRTDGDLLISFTFPGSGIATIEIFEWDSTEDSTPDSSDLVPEDGHWNLIDSVFGAAGADNEDPIIDYFYDPVGSETPATLAERTFGEITLDLALLLGDLLTCPGLGFATVHSRASHEMSSVLRDILPEVEFNLSNCGSLELKKTDDGRLPMAGVTFGLYTIVDGNKGPLAQLPGTPAADLLCVTDAAGICEFPRVPPGEYLLDEVDLPAGYLADSDLPLNVVIEPFGHVDLGDLESEWFVNPRRPDMRLAKIGNGPIDAGDPENAAQYTITVSNVGGPANNVAFVDELPAGITWSAGTRFPDACEIDEEDDRTLSCQWEVFPAGPVLIDVKALTDPTSCAPLVNPIIAVTADDEAESTLADNSAGPVTIGILCPDLQLLKSSDATSVSRGDPVGFSIKVWNSGTGIAYGATVSDPLPAGFEWTVEPDGPDGSDLPAGAKCSVAPGASPTAPSDLSCTLGDLDAGSTEAAPAAVIHVVATDTLLAACGPYNNTASVMAGNDLGDTGSDSLTLLCPGLNIVKTDDDERVEAGDPVGYTLEITNTGPGDAVDVVVTDELPAGLTWTAGTLPEGVTCEIAEGVLTCQLGTLAPLGADEDPPQVIIHLTADTVVPSGNDGIEDCASYPNVASADPTNGLPVLSQSAVVEVRCPLAIELTKTGNALAHVGDTVTYDFTVTNSGYVDLVDIEFADPICAAGTILRTDNGDGDATLEIDLDGAAAGLQREVWSYSCTRVVAATDPDPLPNTATVRGIDVDGRTADDTASWVVDLIRPAIEVVKTVNDESPTVGETVTYTYVVTNTGDTALSKLVILDDKLLLVGEIAALAPQASVTLTKDWLVLAGSPPSIVNVGTATGVDILGKTVTDTDDATITITQVLGVVAVQPAETLPRTGVPVRNLTVIGLTLMLLGFGLHRSRRVDPVV